MTANVVCTGRRYDDPDHPGRYQLTSCATGRGGPWTGERSATGHVTRHEADTLPIAELQARVLANTAALHTAKPCPRCGGRVTLIEREP